MELSPGIKDFVLWLRSKAFHTTDSGDGTSCRLGMEGAIPWHHVFMLVDKSDAFEEADRLYSLLNEKGIPLGSENVDIQLTYSPYDGKVILSVMDLTDSWPDERSYLDWSR